MSSDVIVRTLRVKDRYLDLIRQGRKTLEVRVGYRSLVTVQPGEWLNLTSHVNEQLVRVVDVRRYVTFVDMLRNEDADRIVPGQTESEVLSLLRSIYPARREKLGVVVLEIERADATAPANTSLSR